MLGTELNQARVIRIGLMIERLDQIGQVGDTLVDARPVPLYPWR